MAATRAHTAPSTRPCRGRCCRRVLTPCLARGLTVCPTSPLSSTGPGAASPSSAHDLRRVIQSLRCSSGRCSLHDGPAGLPPSRLYLCSPGILHQREMTGAGGGHSLLLEAVEGLKSSHAEPPHAVQVPLPDGANLYCSWGAPEGNGVHGACGLVFRSVWLWCVVPVVYSRGTEAPMGQELLPVKKLHGWKTLGQRADRLGLRAWGGPASAGEGEA